MGRSIDVVPAALAALFAVACLAAEAGAAERPRARDLGVPLDGTPGALNAITDVAGVEVGQVTLIRGDGPLKRGQGPVRTGVTAVLPRGKDSTTPVFAAWETSNAAGEMTGTVWLEERGYLDGPILITNTHSVGVVRDATIGWMVDRGWPSAWFTPVVAETYDGSLNDINGFHVKAEHALQALSGARGGPVEEGSVGGGTGMICSRFKGGIGTSSRVVSLPVGRYTVGVLVQCNYGGRDRLRIGGAPVGWELRDKYLPCKVRTPDGPCETPQAALAPQPDVPRGRDGSIIVVVATDAPLLPHQLKRLAKRPALAMGRLGDIGGEGSGDIFVAFSTAHPALRSEQDELVPLQAFPNAQLTPVFEAAVQAAEEAIVNAMVAAETITGVDGFRVYALPHDELRAILRKYNRLAEGAR